MSTTMKMKLQIEKHIDRDGSRIWPDTSMAEVLGAMIVDLVSLRDEIAQLRESNHVLQGRIHGLVVRNDLKEPQY